MRDTQTRPRCQEGNMATTEKVRLNLQISQELNRTLEEIAEDTGTNRSDVIRQALALMKVAHTAKKDGRHLGIVKDARKLDTEIVGLI
jgi:metal-responsive CopG/Arc/MetJ family transcriptional regulator